MQRTTRALLAPMIILLLALLALTAVAQGASNAYLPIVARPEPTPTPTPPPTPTPTPTPAAMVEFRGLWVTRFDWSGARTPAKIDEIVTNAADAGFNAILFQVRGEADAFYTPGLEPWSRLLGALGQDPGWDPLAHMIAQAHARGIQVHAYLNVYPVWTGCTPPPDGTTPRHLYYELLEAHGRTDGKPNGLQWTTTGELVCYSYLRASPASRFFDDHVLAVAQDIATRYAVDGIHLDHIRYENVNTSCDPVSEASYGASCFSTNGEISYTDWQRRQVNGTVFKFYDRVIAQFPRLWLSAAVWPSYSGGFASRYQDPRAWLAGGYIDIVAPMIYPATQCPDTSTLTLEFWRSEVSAYQAVRNGRYIVPGIGGAYCTFGEVEARINAARELGVAGHAIFSYSGLLARDFFDDLANGPYAQPAVVPPLTWRP